MASTTTEMVIDGANCPYCLNATLDVLRSETGVSNAQLSALNGCLVVEHENLDPHVLVEIVRSNLHGTAEWGNETVMIRIDPEVAEIHCSHH